MCSKKLLIGLLAITVLFAPVSAWCSPSAPSGSVTLSQAEYDQLVAAMESAKESLRQSSETIKNQSQSLTRLSIFCGVLGLALAAEGIKDVIVMIKAR